MSYKELTIDLPMELYVSLSENADARGMHLECLVNGILYAWVNQEVDEDDSE